MKNSRLLFLAWALAVIGGLGGCAGTAPDVRTSSDSGADTGSGVQIYGSVGGGVRQERSR